MAGTVIAFIGLGIMGSPMSINLLRAGYTVKGFNRTPDKAAALDAAGGEVANSIVEAISGADVVCLMLPDAPDVRSVMLGAEGILERLDAGSLVIDFSTDDPALAVELAEAAGRKGIGFLDAPVSGGEAGAIARTLSIMVGGSHADYERAHPLFEAVGGTVVRVGSSGAGQTVKAANQLMVAIHIGALAEAILFLRSRDVELDSALAAIGSGLAGSKVLEQKAAKMLSHTFDPGFRLRLHDKDLRIALRTAAEAGLTLPLSTIISALVSDAVDHGEGNLDHSVLLLGLERGQ